MWSVLSLIANNNADALSTCTSIHHVNNNVHRLILSRSNVELTCIMMDGSVQFPAQRVGVRGLLLVEPTDETKR